MVQTDVEVAVQVPRHEQVVFVHACLLVVAVVLSVQYRRRELAADVVKQLAKAEEAVVIDPEVVFELVPEDVPAWEMPVKSSSNQRDVASFYARSGGENALRLNM